MRETFSQFDLEQMTNTTPSNSALDDALEDVNIIVEREIARIQRELVPLVVEIQIEIRKMYESEEEAMEMTLKGNPSLKRVEAMERVAAALKVNEDRMMREIGKIREVMRERIIVANHYRERLKEDARSYHFFAEYAEHNQ